MAARASSCEEPDEQVVRLIARVLARCIPLAEQDSTLPAEKRQALAKAPPLEVKRRLEKLLAKAERAPTSPGALRELRALQVLEGFASKEARGLLDRTLVVLASEFSRDMMIEGVPGSTAKDQSRAKADRMEKMIHYGLHRHFTGSGSVLLFGVGMKKGFLYG